MTKFLLFYLLALCLTCRVKAGPTVLPNGDIINYAQPDAPRGPQYIVIAPDGARYEPRWHAMLDDQDYKNLIYLETGRQGDNGNVFIFGH